MRCIKKQSPSNEVHFVTKHTFQDLVLNNPHVDKVYAFKSSLKEIISELVNEKYDVVIDLHHNLRSRLLTFQLRCPVYRFDKLNFRKWLLVQFKINSLPRVHIVDRYLATLKKLNIEIDKEGLEFYIPSQINLFHALIEKQYTALVIGGTHFTKKLPSSKVIEICNQSVQQFVLIGGKEEIETAQEILNQTKGNVLDLCGKISLLESARVIQHASQVVTNDTGMMHIAAAFQKRIISVWGNTVPELGMYPYLKNVDDNIIVQVKNLGCRPCSKIGFADCPKKHFNCMNLIDVHQITKQLT